MLLTLLFALTVATVQAKPYQITAEDQACTNKAINYNELADCFNDIGNRALRYTSAQIKAKNKNLYKKYYQEAKRASKACDKKYLVDDSPYSRAESNQCYMIKMIDLSKKYDKILNHR